jgi:mono/diheme cytochrome c family protein
MRRFIITLVVVLSCISLTVSVISCTKKEEEQEKESVVEKAVTGSLEKANELKEEARERAEMMEEKASEVLEEARKKVEETAVDVKEGAMEVAEEAKEKGTEMAEETKEIVVAVVTKGDPTKGKEKFQQICASCHGPEGHGDGPAAAALNPKPRNLSDATYVSTLTDEHLFKTIKEGGASVGKSPLMPAWGSTLSDDDIRNVIAFIRQNLCKCEYEGK